MGCEAQRALKCLFTPTVFGAVQSALADLLGSTKLYMPHCLLIMATKRNYKYIN